MVRLMSWHGYERKEYAKEYSKLGEEVCFEEGFSKEDLSFCSEEGLSDEDDNQRIDWVDNYFAIREKRDWQM
ncbi:hypothetical protein Tco_1434946 [Tanacetum coccineum]